MCGSPNPPARVSAPAATGAAMRGQLPGEMVQRGADPEDRTVQHPQARLVEVALFGHPGQQIQCRGELLAGGQRGEAPVGRPAIHRPAALDRERHDG